MDEGTCRAADAHDWCGEKDRGRYFAADLGRLAPSARRGLALPCRAGPGLGCTASREPDSSGAQAKGFLLPKFLVTAALVTVCGSCGCANAGGLRAGGGAGGAAAAAFVAPSASLRGALAARHLPTCVHAPALARGPLPQPFPGAPLVRAGACEGLLALRADGGGEEAPGELAGAGQMARQRPAPSSGALRSSRRRTGRQRRREGGSGGGGGGGGSGSGTVRGGWFSGRGQGATSQSQERQYFGPPQDQTRLDAANEQHPPPAPAPAPPAKRGWFGGGGAQGVVSEAGLGPPRNEADGGGAAAHALPHAARPAVGSEAVAPKTPLARGVAPGPNRAAGAARADKVWDEAREWSSQARPTTVFVCRFSPSLPP